ncbi:MAG: hypothetical protein JWL90_516, partial [Chthoniobacteraceae bacterium]|nr:hypothetical protein [Chthoniobacteraceae bacterium]
VKDKVVIDEWGALAFVRPVACDSSRIHQIA